MGMISEINADHEAVGYEKILIAAILKYENCEDEHQAEADAVVIFCKNHVYPNYDSALGEAWRTKPTKDQIRIEEFYKPK